MLGIMAEDTVPPTPLKKPNRPLGVDVIVATALFALVLVCFIAS